ncbi:hypothetical protein CYPRO_2690 [Cyclonatronum proteinivorum]|uniref:Uncharacterized protein n=1 Tax=Cyclonatronum proteinivorum TaxID=1457365 RepID=A0A345UN80_9BACT|nr:hypothetical protein [Cyclonatronum proteinivorum]AXJ01932.1 hypothetical protein CYPRO_2690 [Cyclonatronum proteinivorum]
MAEEAGGTVSAALCSLAVVQSMVQTFFAGFQRCFTRSDDCNRYSRTLMISGCREQKSKGLILGLGSRSMPAKLLMFTKFTQKK